MTDKAYQINRDYSADAAKIAEWFAPALEKLKASGYNLNISGGVLQKLRTTAGLEDELSFMQDIYNKLDLSVNFINLGSLRPLGISQPWISRVRMAPFNPEIDKIFDYTLPERGCLMYIPISGTHPTTNIKWIDSATKVIESEKNKKNYAIEEDTFFPDSPIIVRASQACIFDNRFNQDYMFFIQIGFDDNPSYEEVVEKFSKLA